MRVRPLAFLSALVFGLIVLGCSESPEEPTSPWVGKVAPKFTLVPSTPGGDVKLETYQGQVVLLDFWATWCGPCLQLMPKVAELSKKHKDAGLVVLGVSTELPTTITKFRENKFDPGYPLVVDPSSKTNLLYGITNLPTTVLIGRDGKIRHYEVGSDPENGVANLEKAVIAALAEKA